MNVREDSGEIDGDLGRGGRNKKWQTEFKVKARYHSVEAQCSSLKRPALRQREVEYTLENWQHKESHFATNELLVNVLMNNKVTKIIWLDCPTSKSLFSHSSKEHLVLTLQKDTQDLIMQLYIVQEVSREAEKRMRFPLSMSYIEECPVAAHSSITAILNGTPQGLAVLIQGRQAYFLFTSHQTLENALPIELWALNRDLVSYPI